MKKHLLSLAVAAMLASMTRTRAHTQDVAFTFRMGAGFPGDVNRTHPASIVAGLIDQANPVRLFGDPVLGNGANGYRGFQLTDTATPVLIQGVAVRPYPTQQTSGGMSSSFGTGAPALNQPIDVLEHGFIMAKCNYGTPVKGGAVYVRITASATVHVLGGFEGQSDTTNSVLVTNAEWAGPPDASGIAEIRVWKQH